METELAKLSKMFKNDSYNITLNCDETEQHLKKWNLTKVKYALFVFFFVWRVLLGRSHYVQFPLGRPVADLVANPGRRPGWRQRYLVAGHDSVVVIRNANPNELFNA